MFDDKTFDATIGDLVSKFKAAAVAAAAAKTDEDAAQAEVAIANDGLQAAQHRTAGAEADEDMAETNLLDFIAAVRKGTATVDATNTLTIAAENNTPPGTPGTPAAA